MQKSTAKDFFDNMSRKHHGIEPCSEGLLHLLNFYQHNLSNTEKARLNESLAGLPLYRDMLNSAADHFPRSPQQKNGLM